MSALTTLRNLLRRHPEAEPAEAEQDRDTAAAEVAAAEAAVTAAEAAYRAGLLEANPADLRALDENRRAAAIRVDQARAFLAALETRLAEAQDREAERRKRIEAARAALAAQLRRGLKPPPGRLWVADTAALLIIGPTGAIPASGAACAALAPLAVGGRHPEPSELRAVLDTLVPRLAAVGLRICRRKGGVRIARVKPSSSPAAPGAGTS